MKFFMTSMQMGSDQSGLGDHEERKLRLSVIVKKTPIKCMVVLAGKISISKK